MGCVDVSSDVLQICTTTPKQVVPILEMVDADGKLVVMPESMDIVKRVDEDPRWGPPLLKPATNREDIKAFFDSIADLSRRCTRPRFAQSAVLPEFHTPQARAAFVRNHPLKPPSDYMENYKNIALGAYVRVRTNGWMPGMIDRRSFGSNHL